MRVCAHAYAAYGNDDNGGEFTQQEKHYYNQVLCRIFNPLNLALFTSVTKTSILLANYYHSNRVQINCHYFQFAHLRTAK